MIAAMNKRTSLGLLVLGKLFFIEGGVVVKGVGGVGGVDLVLVHGPGVVLMDPKDERFAADEGDQSAYLEVRSHVGVVVLHGNTLCLQGSRWANSGQEKKLRRGNGTSGDDHFFGGSDIVQSTSLRLLEGNTIHHYSGARFIGECGHTSVVENIDVPAGDGGVQVVGRRRANATTSSGW